MPEDVVLLHGFTQTGASWEPVIRALGARYRALAPDLRGHGAAAGVRPVSLPAVLGDLDAVVARGAALVGYSMGGRIALAYALSRPGRLGRLVLLGASPGLDDGAERAARRGADEALAARLERIGLAAFAEEWGAQELFAGQPPEAAAAAHADRLRNTTAGLIAALRGLGTSTLEPLWDRLGELRIPVTLAVGERDAKFRATAERMAGALADARLVVIPQAGHAVQLERPEAVAGLLQRSS
ncbi:MAG TPA: alpha/beta fold hydrolase [Solirubrobacteraceae bacterium]|nr:alpha/beta fold hydrolase [Solirubrobacteraceae bacterium]